MTAIEHATTFLRYVYPEGSIAVLAVAATDSTMFNGRYTDLDLMATQAVNMSADGDSFAACYYTLNPAAPDKAKSIGDFNANALRHRGRSMRDTDVQGRSLYLVDLDPVRPAGVCSTDHDKATAITTADEVQAFLTTKGWPEPIRVDSGNGIHLLYRGDMCNPTSPAWAYVLKQLDSMFGGDTVSIDTSVHNAARLSRLPGTWNRKGENTPERPHRRCKVISYPEQWTSVDHGPMIYKLAASLGFDRVDRKTVERAGDRPEMYEDVHNRVLDFAAEFDLNVTNTREADGKTYYDLDCPFAGRAHTGTGRKSSIIVNEAENTIGFNCFSADCDGLGMQDLIEHLHAETGRWPQTRFYARTEESLERRRIRDEEWQNKMLEREMKEHYDRKESVMRFDPSWAWDKASFDEAGQATLTDPTSYGLNYADLAEPFRAWSLRNVQDMDETDSGAFTVRCVAAHAEQDAQAIADIVGPTELWHLYRGISRPEEAGLPWWKNQGDPLLNATQMRHALAEYQPETYAGR